MTPLLLCTLIMVTAPEKPNIKHHIDEFYGIYQIEYIEEDNDEDIYICEEDIELSSDVIEINEQKKIVEE